MSRCFSYPPPGYCRNGATYEALIESIKLQKETDKEKAERRKEKRAKKEKKEKKKTERENRKNDEKVKLQKNQSQDSHKLQKVAGFTEAQIKGTKTNNELLERSDLTEEHGQPIKPSYSSDSTQNSNKRRRDDDDDVLLPDDSTGHGKPIKIRLLKKHKGSDSSNSGEDAGLKTVPFVHPSKLARTQFVSSTRNSCVPATSGRENNALQGNPLTQTKSNTSFERTQISNSNRPNGLHLGQEQLASSSSANPILQSGSRKSDAKVLKSRQQIESFVRPVVRQTQSHLENEIPSTSLSRRNIGVQGVNSGRQQQGPSNLNPGVPSPVSNLTSAGKRSVKEITYPGSSGLSKPVSSNLNPWIPGPVSDERNPTTAAKRPINEITVPGSIVLTKPEKKNEDPKKAGHTRAEKKLMKKHAKYEKLIGSWVPPAIQDLVPDVADDEDWLSRKTETVKQSSISRGEVETCREVAATSLWQPHARFLAEADIYALPYTVPF